MGDDLRQLIKEPKGEFILPQIYRSGVGSDWGHYLNLYIEAFSEGGATLPVTMTDVTEQTLLELELRQEHNKLRLELMGAR
jgi:hypothetical protein